MPRNRDEARMQETIVAWCRNRGLRPIAALNEGKKNAVQAAIAKRMGLEPGVPDLLILERPSLYPQYRGVALELKTLKGRVSPAQRTWMDRAEKHGWLCEVIRSKEQAVDLLERLGF